MGQIIQFLFKIITKLLSIECFVLAIFIIIIAFSHSWLKRQHRIEFHYIKVMFIWLIIITVITLVLTILSIY